MMFGFALSGLQEFLYDLSPENLSRDGRSLQGGRDRDAARRLRIRSALLTLVPGLVAWEFGKADANFEVVYLGGGKLFAKTSEGALEAIGPKLRDLYSWLVRRSGGKLAAYWTQSLGSESASASLQGLLAALGEAKWRAGRSEGGWAGVAGDIVELPKDGTLGNRTWERDEGATFARREDWQGFRVSQDGWEIGPWRVKPVTEKPEIAMAGKALASVEVCIPTYTPKQNGDTVPLYELAEFDADGRERGGAYLGLLKLDGDSIGALMAEALENDRSCEAYRKTSRRLADFFGPDLASLLRSNYPRLYLVYSGGDDLVATGYFMDALRAVRDIQARFQRSGIDASVSAGVTFYNRQASILRAIEAAEAELENAKQNEAVGPRHKRNAVSVAGCRLSWDDLRRTLEEVDELSKTIESGALNRGALNLLRQLGEPWLEGASEAERDLRYRSIPQMAYVRSRRTGWKESEWPDAVRVLFDSLQNDETDWPRASLVGTLAAWSTKRPMEEE